MALRSEQISLHLNAYLAAHTSPPDAVLRELAETRRQLGLDDSPQLRVADRRA